MAVACFHLVALTPKSCRLSKASSASGRPSTRVRRERGITQATKIAVYRAVVLPTLLYGCETWTCYRRHLKKLDQFHLRCLRRLLGISWKDRITYQEVLRHSSMPDVEVLIRSSVPNRLTALAGRVARQSAIKTPSRTLCAPFNILQQIVALGGWQPTMEPSLGGKAAVTARHQTPSQESAEGQHSCCRRLPGVWTHLYIGVWSAITPEAPLTSSSLRDGSQ